MAGKDFLRGILLAMLWWALIIAALYAAASLAVKPWDMRRFSVLMLAAWPLLAGFCAGWQDGKRHGNSGFAAALRWVIIPLALLGALWWWILPQLWQAALYGKFALYVTLAALLSGGFSAGLAKARQALYPPRPDDTDDDSSDDDKEV